MGDVALPDAPPVMRRILPSRGWSMGVMFDPLSMIEYISLNYRTIELPV